MPASDVLPPSDRFARRHIGPDQAQRAEMLSTLGVGSLDALIAQAVPAVLRTQRTLSIPPAATEAEALAELAALAGRNEVRRSLIGMGYHDTVTPPVVLRNILENPGWYTAYTPYQAEISQGRMEALLNFQTMVAELCGLDIANASMLDEGTAAAEAMTMSWGLTHATGSDRFFVDAGCHPQTIAVVQTRAAAVGIDILVGDPAKWTADTKVFGALVQYPASHGAVRDLAAFTEAIHAAGGMVVAATDLLALTLLTPPGAWGADIAVGSAQRFGVPLGYGGPHAGFFATKDAHKRHMPGRLIGVSIDRHGKPAMRLTLQTREQHIRREKATSNICTAQVLLAVIASMYAVWHGPEGLTRIAQRAHGCARLFAKGVARLGWTVETAAYFDTVTVRRAGGAAAVHAAAAMTGFNLRPVDDDRVTVAFDELSDEAEVQRLLTVFAPPSATMPSLTDLVAELPPSVGAGPHGRTTPFLTHPVFHSHRSETEMLRYIHRLEAKDLSLNHSMIPLGSCTMKLNATTEMIPVTMAGFGKIHPFAPVAQAQGYQELFTSLERWLADLTGFTATSLQPNAGSQGEYAGLLVIRRYHEARGDHHRNVCLIPTSAHGTNPASAAMAHMKIVLVKCDDQGNIDVGDLRARAVEHRDALAALMVTYPSTHGVFEAAIKEICKIIHDNGGMVYMDGANLNAQVGLMSPGELGADVCHINLHKTFCIPHGGGGPGMGPICCNDKLAPYLPGHPLVTTGGTAAVGPVSAAPWGSASILPISWAYIRMMGGDGLTDATKVAILNANYLAARLSPYFPVLYKGADGRVAHECILDLRPLKASTGVEVEDVAKRLMDYGFHAPTVSFPVVGTLMVEPTESESKAELDRFADALIAIHGEMMKIADGTWPKDDNPLKMAPHTAEDVTADEWTHPYSRSTAAFPAPWVRAGKFWPAVGRVNNVYGDRNVMCSCPPVEAYGDE